ncbi:MAG: hypothetical protein ACI4ER_04765 [Suilimivivens sp.]
MLKEFYADLKESYKNNKWMNFEFRFRWPFSILLQIIVAVVYMITDQSFAGIITLLVVIVSTVVTVILLYFTMVRKKYSYRCWITLLILDGLYSGIGGGAVEWISSGICTILLLIYYHKRKSFFYKERTLTSDD